MNEKNYMHRDLKSDNIVLNFNVKGPKGMRLDRKKLLQCYDDVSTCEVKICDLGFARALEPGTLNQSFNSGNCAFASPEKLLGS
jgi:serine/threonine protein kinase